MSTELHPAAAESTAPEPASTAQAVTLTAIPSQSRTAARSSRASTTVSAPGVHTLNLFRWSQRTGALVSGSALAAMVPLSIFGYFIAFKGLVTTGDATKTADAISASPLLWFAGIASLFAVVVLDIVAAAGWFALFRPVNRVVSSVAAVARAVYGVIFAVAIAQLVVASAQLNEPLAALGSTEAFWTIWQASLGLFGIALLITAWLAYRSGFVPRILGILLGIAGIGYLADLIGLTFVGGFAPTFGLFGFVGETAIIVWLLTRGRRLPRS